MALQGFVAASALEMGDEGDGSVSDEESLASTAAPRHHSIRSLLSFAAISIVVMAALWAVRNANTSVRIPQAQSDNALSLSLPFNHTIQENCLCVFDIDRTLTSKQQWANAGHPCPGAFRTNIWDTGYEAGNFVASALAVQVDNTFCKRCYTGIVSAGTASGKDMHDQILVYIGTAEKTRTDWWQYIGFNTNTPEVSSLILQAVNGKKQEHVRGIVDWLRTKMQVTVLDTNVYFYDDIAANVEPFKETQFNARQISCTSRDYVPSIGGQFGKIGGCGATPQEIVEEKGVKLCGEY